MPERNCKSCINHIRIETRGKAWASYANLPLHVSTVHMVKYAAFWIIKYNFVCPGNLTLIFPTCRVWLYFDQWLVHLFVCSYLLLMFFESTYLGYCFFVWGMLSIFRCLEKNRLLDLSEILANRTNFLIYWNWCKYLSEPINYTTNYYNRLIHVSVKNRSVDTYT